MTGFLRKIFGGLLNSIAAFLDGFGIKPNYLTLFGLAGHFLAAWLIAEGFLIAGALVLVFFGLFDSLDGALARFQDRVSRFGAFLDSVCDRFSEAAIFFGLFYYFLSRDSFLGGLFVLAAALGALLVSYTRARAESVEVIPKLGIMTRVERYIVLVLSLLLDKIEIGLVIIAGLSLFTIGQRIWFVYRQLGEIDS